MSKKGVVSKANHFFSLLRGGAGCLTAAHIQVISVDRYVYYYIRTTLGTFLNDKNDGKSLLLLGHLR